MKNPKAFALALSLALFTGSLSLCPVEAAKKYYPPGFTPPADPAPSTTDPAPTRVIIQQTPGEKQVIIKTVPVVRTARPQDPLAALIDERRFYEALRMLDGRLKKAPNNLSLQMLRAQILRDSGNYDEAIEQYESIHEHGRNSATKAGALNGLGWTYYQLGLKAHNAGDRSGYETYLRSAETSFRQAIKLNPSNVYPWTGLAEWAMENGLLPEATAAIQKAGRLAPDNLNVKLAQARLKLAEGRPEEALNQLYGLKKTHDRNPQVYLLLAKSSLELDRVDDTIIHLKQLLELMPEHTAALKLLSTAYERKMKPEDAQASLEKAVAINPADEQSVDALLKIYDQGYEAERAILLLKTLLKERPAQQSYQLKLLSRFKQAGRWDELYEAGSVYIDAALHQDATQPDPVVDQLVGLFTQAAFHRSKGMINREAFLDQPLIRKVWEYSQARLEGDNQLTHRLSLLLLNPLSPLPPLDSGRLDALGPPELATALKITFLQGDQATYNALLSRWESLHPDLTGFDGSRAAMNLAADLLFLGDYAGAERVAQNLAGQNQELAAAQALLKQIGDLRTAAREQLASLEMLPRKIPDSYWEKTASDALKLGTANWKTHALLAERLSSHDRHELALQHLRLAAQYAPTEKDRRRWEKRVAKVERRLKKS